MDSDTSRGSGTRGNKAARGTNVEECQRPGAAGQPPWRALARQAALRGKRVAGLPAAAYGGVKDVSAAWAAGVLDMMVGCRPPRTERKCTRHVCAGLSGAHLPGPPASPSRRGSTLRSTPEQGVERPRAAWTGRAGCSRVGLTGVHEIMPGCPTACGGEEWHPC
jgi:hypothetical protein